MNARYRHLWICIAACHLGLVTLGASAVSLRGLGLPGRALDEYGTLSGANSGYGFFTPGVSYQLGARFEIIDRDGRTSRASLATGTSHALVRTGSR